MPHLQFDINFKIPPDKKEKFKMFAEKKFSEIMKTGSDHIAISIRECGRNDLSLGRASKDQSICLMNLDIRAGRTKSQKRNLAILYMKGLRDILGIQEENQYLTFTEHSGEQFNLIEKNLDDWEINDDPLKKERDN